MAANKRIYYAVHQVGIGSNAAYAGLTAAHGVQSVGMTTNFNLEQVFELGQLAIYENIEEIPDVEITLNKVLDGYPLLYHLATVDATSPTLAGRSNARAVFGLSIFSDTADSSAGTALSSVQCSGMFVSSLSYTFPVDGNFTEDVTLVGNDKIWLNDTKPTNPDVIARIAAVSFDGAFAGNNDEPIGQGGVNRRQDLVFDGTGVDSTVLPYEVYGISSSGTNDSSGGDFGAHVTNISCSADLGREEIFELGRRSPYHRPVTFPIEVTCEVETISISGDMVSATEEGIYGSGSAFCIEKSNLVDRTIRIATCEGTRIYLGDKNKLASVSYAGGDAGGGNVTTTYSFTTFNDMTVLHSGDPGDTLSWWTNRDDYLGG